jgi:hypothetical protein
MRLPRTRFLAHSLVHYDGETEAEKVLRLYPGERIAGNYADTLIHFPPTRVSMMEFEATMREVRDESNSVVSLDRAKI